LTSLPAMNDQDSNRSPGGNMLRFALHRQGQNSQVSTRCHGIACRGSRNYWSNNRARTTGLIITRQEATYSLPPTDSVPQRHRPGVGCRGRDCIIMQVGIRSKGPGCAGGCVGVRGGTDARWAGRSPRFDGERGQCLPLVAVCRDGVRHRLRRKEVRPHWWPGSCRPGRFGCHGETVRLTSDTQTIVPVQAVNLVGSRTPLRASAVTSGTVMRPAFPEPDSAHRRSR
jgi:hypothetical protein